MHERFDVLTEVNIHIVVFWIMMLCRSHFYPENGGSRLLYNVGDHLHTGLHGIIIQKTIQMCDTPLTAVCCLVRTTL